MVGALIILVEGAAAAFSDTELAFKYVAPALSCVIFGVVSMIYTIGSAVLEHLTPPPK